MDTSAFQLACRQVMGEERQRQGVGTLGEKTQHAVLKRYLEPRTEFHEIRAGHYVADIRNEAGFIEIQTRQFYRLQKKLEEFLKEAPVTVVYPIPARRQLIWMDSDGTCDPPKRIGRLPTACAVLPELYSVKGLLHCPGLSFRLLLLEVEDYRIKDGYGKERKRHSTKFDRFPIDLLGEIRLEKPEDYCRLIPDELPDTFTAKEFAKAAKLSAKDGPSAMLVLIEMGAVERIGKKGRAYLYQRVKALT